MAYPESPHPYKSNTTDTQTYTGDSNLVQLSVTFDPQTAFATGDLLYVQDGSGNDISGSPFSGTDLAGQTVLVPWNVVKIILVSLPGTKAWGYKVTNIVGWTPRFNFMTYHL